MLKRITVFLCFAVASGLAFSQDMRKEERAMLNAGRVADQILGVLPEFVPVIVKRIANQELPRIAPEQPIWILDLTSGLILHYQGKPEFSGQLANRLTDENGIRFGQLALNSGLQGNSIWLSITLGGAPYRAFCRSREPFVVCSLAI